MRGARAAAGSGADLPGSTELRRLTVAALEDLVDAVPEELLPRLIALLADDPRRGARRCLARAQRRWDRVRRERRRYAERFRYEWALWRRGFRLVAGVDEAGRGPLAGPVVAAAVVLSPDTYIAGLDDSKCLDARAREALDAVIRRVAVDVGVGVASVDEIDRLNIFHAAQLAMRRAIGALSQPPGYLIVDGLRLRDIDIPQLALPGGDRRSNSVAAASIVAKVYRDRLMDELDQRYPQYGFARHKGYATSEHRRALELYGPCPEHRRSFGRDAPWRKEAGVEAP